MSKRAGMTPDYLPLRALMIVASGSERERLGFGFDYIGGTNVSAIHWDIVKDLRFGGRIELDGKVVQENGIWVASTAAPERWPTRKPRRTHVRFWLDERTRRQAGARKRRGHDGRDMDRGLETVPSLARVCGTVP